MISYKDILERKEPDMTITVQVKDSRKAQDAQRNRKVKFKDESSTYFVFANEKQQEKAMEILDDKGISFDIQVEQ